MDLKTRANPSIQYSPSFSPPEQYSAETKQDKRSDIYSLGALGYFLVAGKAPPDAMQRLNRARVTWPKGVDKNYRKRMEWALSVRSKDRPGSINIWRKKQFSDSSSENKKEGNQKSGLKFEEVSIVDFNDADLQSGANKRLKFEWLTDLLKNKMIKLKYKMSRERRMMFYWYFRRWIKRVSLLIMLTALVFYIATSNSPYAVEIKQNILAVFGGVTTFASQSLETGEEVGYLAISTTPTGANIEIDEKGVFRSPVDDLKLQSGEYTLHFSKDGYLPEIRKIYISEGDVVVLDVVLYENSPSGHKLKKSHAVKFWIKMLALMFVAYTVYKAVTAIVPGIVLVGMIFVFIITFPLYYLFTSDFFMVVPLGVIVFIYLLILLAVGKFIEKNA